LARADPLCSEMRTSRTLAGLVRLGSILDFWLSRHGGGFPSESRPFASARSHAPSGLEPIRRTRWDPRHTYPLHRASRRAQRGSRVSKVPRANARGDRSGLNPDIEPAVRLDGLAVLYVRVESRWTNLMHFSDAKYADGCGVNPISPCSPRRAARVAKIECPPAEGYRRDG
jgi:hypothetical protein